MERNRRKTRVGIVTSDKMDKTVVVATEEIVYGDNDSLSAIVARLIHADALIILSDIDGLFEDNPNENPDARLIPVVDEITPEIKALAGDAGSARGTGGMITKLQAADYATKRGVEVHVINGSNPENLYEIFDGNNIGTMFLARQ